MLFNILLASRPILHLEYALKFASNTKMEKPSGFIETKIYSQDFSACASDRNIFGEQEYECAFNILLNIGIQA